MLMYVIAMRHLFFLRKRSRIAFRYSRFPLIRARDLSLDDGCRLLLLLRRRLLLLLSLSLPSWAWRRRPLELLCLRCVGFALLQRSRLCPRLGSRLGLRRR
jgi:hypothetical protein